jgi:hypothetical protein
LDFENEDGPGALPIPFSGPSIILSAKSPQALLDWWYRLKPDDGQGLPEAIKPIFTEICDTQIAKFKHGRLCFPAHALSLFRVDKAWAEQHLLPLLDWSRSEAEELPGSMGGLLVAL